MVYQSPCASTLPARTDPASQALTIPRVRTRCRCTFVRPRCITLRHTFVATMLDAGVSLRDVQIAARHADPRTTMRYDRARKNLDRHPNYILAAYMASGTEQTVAALPMRVRL